MFQVALLTLATLAAGVNGAVVDLTGKTFADKTGKGTWYAQSMTFK